MCAVLFFITSKKLVESISYQTKYDVRAPVGKESAKCCALALLPLHIDLNLTLFLGQGPAANAIYCPGQELELRSRLEKVFRRRQKCVMVVSTLKEPDYW